MKRTHLSEPTNLRFVHIHAADMTILAALDEKAQMHTFAMHNGEGAFVAGIHIFTDKIIGDLSAEVQVPDNIWEALITHDLKSTSSLQRACELAQVAYHATQRTSTSVIDLREDFSVARQDSIPVQIEEPEKKQSETQSIPEVPEVPILTPEIETPQIPVVEAKLDVSVPVVMEQEADSHKRAREVDEAGKETKAEEKKEKEEEEEEEEPPKKRARTSRSVSRSKAPKLADSEKDMLSCFYIQFGSAVKKPGKGVNERICDADEKSQAFDELPHTFREYLCEMSPYSITVDGKKYATPQHLIEASKFLTTAPDFAKLFTVESQSPFHTDARLAKQAGDKTGKVMNKKRIIYKRPNTVKADLSFDHADVYEKVMTQMFQQNSHAAKILLMTGNAILLHGSRGKSLQVNQPLMNVRRKLASG